MFMLSIEPHRETKRHLLIRLVVTYMYIALLDLYVINSSLFYYFF